MHVEALQAALERAETLDYLTAKLTVRELARQDETGWASQGQVDYWTKRLNDLPNNEPPQIIRFTDKQTGDTLQTMTEENYRRNAALPWQHRDMPLKDILDAFNETSTSVRGDIVAH